MILILNHKDSFVYNLLHWLSPLDVVRIADSGQSTYKLESEARLLVFSPGPGHPEDYPDSMKKLEYWHTRKPVLGVCLSFQMLICLYGGRIQRLPAPLHGLARPLEVLEQDELHAGLGHFVGGCYNSLGTQDVPAGLIRTVADASGTLMGVRVQDKPVFAVQYHPESFLCNVQDSLRENLAACIF